MNNNRVYDLVRIAMMLAITLVFQIGFRQFGQMVVGVLVNLVLLMTVMATFKSGGVLVGVTTPFVAFAFGIMKVLQLVPLIAVANAVFCLVFGMIYFRKKTSMVNAIIAVIVAALVKFIILYGGSHLILPMFMENVPAPLYISLGVIQIYTALTGGVAAVLIAKIIPARYFERHGEI